MAPQPIARAHVDQFGFDKQLLARARYRAEHYAAHVQFAAGPQRVELRDTEPNTTQPTCSSRPALSGSTFALSYRYTEPRALTRSVGIRERSLMSDSVMPSVRYSISGSCIRFSKGSTATESEAGGLGILKTAATAKASAARATAAASILRREWRRASPRMGGDVSGSVLIAVCPAPTSSTGPPRRAAARASPKSRALG